MNREFDTLELARVYESQGYFQEALGIYQALEGQDQAKNPEIRAGLERMISAVQNQAPPLENDRKPSLESDPFRSLDPEKKIETLLEQWLMLMVLEKRLGLFQKIKTRL